MRAQNGEADPDLAQEVPKIAIKESLRNSIAKKTKTDVKGAERVPNVNVLITLIVSATISCPNN